MVRMTAIMICAVLAGCQAVPGEGPLTADIKKDAGQSPTQIGRIDAAVFDIVNVDNRTAKLVSDYVATALNRRFGFGGGAGRAVIGVGDQLKISIFEAGADGLFSTTESKQTSLDVVVQQDGTAAIPYVGSIRFAGKTLEEARQEILSSLRSRAVEPDVIVSSVNTASRKVTVSGAVGSSAQVPLGLVGEKITDVIAKAGGPSGQPYETYVTLVRGKKTGTALLSSVIDNPSENIYVQPGDQIFVARDPRTFTLLGAVRANARINFGASDLNLLEAVALGGGGNDAAVDAKGYFLFRYEEADIVMSLLGRQRFNELLSKGMKPDRLGRYPIVYSFDMTHPDSLLVGQTFPVKNRDVIYASRHTSVDLRKFLALIGAPIGIASQGAGVAYNLERISD
ncbi:MULTISPECIES: polysaccharide biosynthesis/export family protein [Rhizobium/Agrobacterium group]|uniref:Polysaccharide biosynthesis/export family protein n=2 Tax=Neorhizobium TaxID=1525371 RepID=A0ABV0M0W6_9HYPH|nr:MULTISPECIES: polysaccharide biosynthesis/export family protein [Rhizobium/Agrobacterium group]KGD99349.1 capsule biosynthesis protein [Rhizobium sp. YS-1r]MCC2609342.1 polysaccharide export protein [Neorhizobium petrolearium]WGI69560.1 polysaccharide export protein [Neorhizobium petrolearium]